MKIKEWDCEALRNISQGGNNSPDGEAGITLVKALIDSALWHGEFLGKKSIYTHAGVAGKVEVHGGGNQRRAYFYTAPAWPGEGGVK